MLETILISGFFFIFLSLDSGSRALERIADALEKLAYTTPPAPKED